MPKMHGFTPDYNKNIGEADDELNDDGIAPLAAWSREDPVYCEVRIDRTPGVEHKPDYRVTVECESDDVDIDDEWYSTRTDARSRCFDYMTNTPRDLHADYRPEGQTEIPTETEEATGLDAIDHNLNTEKIVSQYKQVAQAGADMDDTIDVRQVAFDEGCHMLCLTLDREVYEHFHDVLSEQLSESETEGEKVPADD